MNCFHQKQPQTFSMTALQKQHPGDPGAAIPLLASPAAWAMGCHHGILCLHAGELLPVPPMGSAPFPLPGLSAPQPTHLHRFLTHPSCCFAPTHTKGTWQFKFCTPCGWYRWWVGKNLVLLNIFPSRGSSGPCFGDVVMSCLGEQ